MPSSESFCLIKADESIFLGSEANLKILLELQKIHKDEEEEEDWEDNNDDPEPGSLDSFDHLLK